MAGNQRIDPRPSTALEYSRSMGPRELTPSSVLGSRSPLCSVSRIVNVDRCDPQTNNLSGNWLLVALLFAIFLLASCKPMPAQIGLGVMLPLTGEGATLGQDCKNGVELALAESNAMGGAQILATYEDSQGKPQLGVNAYNKFRNQGIRVILGDLFSGPTLAVAPLADRDKVFLFSPGASNPKLTGVSKYVFRNYPSDNFEGKLIAKYAKQKGYDKVAVLHPTNEYGVGLTDVFSDTFRKLGGEIVLVEGYSDEETDFRGVLGKVSRSGAKALYLPGYYAAVARIAVQSRQLNITVPMLSNVGVEDPKLLELGRNAVEGLTYTAPAVDLSAKDPVVQAFVTAYRGRFHKEPGFPAAHGYDTAKIMSSLLRRFGSDPDRLREGLIGQEYTGVTGTMKFDLLGDVSKPFMIKTVKNGQFVAIAKISR